MSILCPEAVPSYGLIAADTADNFFSDVLCGDLFGEIDDGFDFYSFVDRSLKRLLEISKDRGLGSFIEKTIENAIKKINARQRLTDEETDEILEYLGIKIEELKGDNVDPFNLWKNSQNGGNKRGIFQVIDLNTGETPNFVMYFTGDRIRYPYDAWPLWDQNLFKVIPPSIDDDNNYVLTPEGRIMLAEMFLLMSDIRRFLIENDQLDPDNPLFPKPLVIYLRKLPAFKSGSVNIFANDIEGIGCSDDLIFRMNLDNDFLSLEIFEQADIVFHEFDHIIYISETGFINSLESLTQMVMLANLWKFSDEFDYIDDKSVEEKIDLMTEMLAYSRMFNLRAKTSRYVMAPLLDLALTLASEEMTIQEFNKRFIEYNRGVCDKDLVERLFSFYQSLIDSNIISSVDSIEELFAIVLLLSQEGLLPDQFPSDYRYESLRRIIIGKLRELEKKMFFKFSVSENSGVIFQISTPLDLYSGKRYISKGVFFPLEIDVDSLRKDQPEEITLSINIDGKDDKFEQEKKNWKFLILSAEGDIFSMDGENIFIPSNIFFDKHGQKAENLKAILIYTGEEEFEIDYFKIVVRRVRFPEGLYLTHLSNNNR